MKQAEHMTREQLFKEAIDLIMRLDEESLKAALAAALAQGKKM